MGTKPTNWVELLLDGKWRSRPTREELEPYLAANRRSAESLLAAFRAGGGPELLQEAMQKYPDDPRVAFVAFSKSQSPEDRRRWLDAFKKATPDNALANYLSAAEHFKSGQADLAIAEVVAAAEKPKWQDFSREFMFNAEEAYRSAGYSDAEAKVMAECSLPLPHLAPLKELGRQIGEVAKQYQQANDQASMQATLQLGVNLAREVRDGGGPPWMIQDLVAIAVERQVLQAADPASLYDAAGHTVNHRLEELAAQREEIMRLSRQSEVLMRNLSDQELIRYLNRLQVSGEVEGVRWLINRHGQ